MRIEHFRYLFNRLNGFYLTKTVIVFRKPLEIWDSKTGESTSFKTVDELLNFKIKDKTVRQIIEKSETLYVPPLEGSRGASGESKTFHFGSAGGDGPDKTKSLLPAYANTKIKSKTLEGAMAEFQKRFKDSDHEWAYEVDSQGYVHQFVEGNRSSVRIGSSTRDTMILHNHPSGGAFSDADLISTSMDRRSRGIVASGRRYDYVFTKGGHFKANDFVKAVKKAELKGRTYDEAADKWLKKNQKQYGYKYYRKKN